MRATLAWLRESGFICNPATCKHCDGPAAYVDSLKSRKLLAEYLAEHAKITLQCDPETDDPIDHFGYDTDEENKQAAAHVRELAERSEWGWCVAMVTVEIDGVRATEYLGGCSYASEQDFRDSGCFADMVHCCCVDLASQLVAARETLNRVWYHARHATPVVSDPVATKSARKGL